MIHHDIILVNNQIKEVFTVTLDDVYPIFELEDEEETEFVGFQDEEFLTGGS